MSRTSKAAKLNMITALASFLDSGAGQPVQDCVIGTDIIMSKTDIMLGGEITMQSVKLKPQGV